jgi:hypothetical protein
MASSLSMLRLPFLNQQPLPPQTPVFADFDNSWDILTPSYEEVFDFDSVVDMNYDHAQKVAKFPVEPNTFASYDKVNEPRTIKLKCTVHGGQRVANFFNALETALTSTNLYLIVTPEVTYQNMTLVKLPYTRTAKKSVDMVVVDLVFEEIVQTQFQTVAAKGIVTPKKAKSTTMPSTQYVSSQEPKNSVYGVTSADPPVSWIPKLVNPAGS